MAQNPPEWTVAEIAQRLSGVVLGDGERKIVRPVSAGTHDEMGITFAGNTEYLAMATSGPIGAVLVGHDATHQSATLIQVANPRAAFGEVLSWMVRPIPIEAGIHPTASVDSAARVDPTAFIGANAVIASGAIIGARAKVHALSYVGDGCEVGDDCELYPRSVLVQDVILGPRTIIHSGAVIGADGFGFEWDGVNRVKIPQIGGVKIGADCEIGANTCIDRATLSDTVIENGVKIDNLCQIGHNVSIGERTVIAGMVGIGGSSALGKRMMVGANVGISDHIVIADDVVLGGRTGVAQNLPEKGEYFGSPAQPMRDGLRTWLTIPKLPELWNRLRSLERRVDDMDKESK